MKTYIQECQDALGLKSAPLTDNEIEQVEFVYSVLSEITTLFPYTSILSGGPCISFGGKRGVPVFAIYRRKNTQPDARLEFGFRTQDAAFRKDIKKHRMHVLTRFELNKIQGADFDSFINYIVNAIQIPTVQLRLGLNNRIPAALEILALVKVRGNPHKIFQKNLHEHYGNKCPVTGCTALPLLDAAHLIPVANSPQDVYATENGLLLRTDIHRMFDTKLLRFEVSGSEVKIHLAQSVRSDPTYSHYHDTTLKLPSKNREQLLKNIATGQALRTAIE